MMDFTEQTINHHTAFYCGSYKIVPRFIRELGSVRFYAYYKPAGWKCWGNRVCKTTENYPDFESAVAACADHDSREN